MGARRPRSRRAAIDARKDAPDGDLVLVTAITPTPAGEGKTTTTIGLTQALQGLGHRALSATREPSLGPVFGVKGGAAGGGYAQVLPMEDINLHFTGDFAAISAAHNLLAAMLDNHLHQGNALGIDARRVLWRRVIDMNDRSLHGIVAGLGGRTRGVPRETGFDITPASEVMAVLCLARDLEDLKAAVCADRGGGAETGRLCDGGRPDRPSRDGDPDAGGGAAEPGAERGRRSSADSRGAVREHRARLQLAGGHAAGPKAGRFGGDGGGVRSRPGR